MVKGVYALTFDGRITLCKSRKIGYGRCNHIISAKLANIKRDEFIKELKENYNIDLNNKNILYINNNYNIDNKIYGIQSKYFYKNKFIKIDSNEGFDKNEGLAEELSSIFLSYTNLNNIVKYESKKINILGKEFNCSISENFLNKNESLIPLKNIFSNNELIKLNEELENEYEIYDYLKKLINYKTNLDEKYINSYLIKMLAIDILISNPDRHFENIALIEDKYGNYKFSPIFDNGSSSLLADSNNLYTNDNYINIMRNLPNMTFNGIPMENIINLVHNNINSKEDLLIIDKENLFKELTNYKNNLYKEEDIKRAIDVLMYRLEELEDYIWLNKLKN